MSVFYFFFLSRSKDRLDAVVAAEVVVRHLERCKQISFLRYALPVIIPESNIAQAAIQLQRVLKQDYQLKCQFMTEDKKKNSKQYDLPGSVTTHQNKLEMVDIIKELYMKPNKLFFYHDFVVAVSESATATSGINVKKEFERQLRDFARIKKFKTGKDGSPYCEFFYHGKSSGGNDDLVMCLLIAGLMKKRFSEKEKYAGIRAK